MDGHKVQFNYRVIYLYGLWMVIEKTSRRGHYTWLNKVLLNIYSEAQKVLYDITYYEEFSAPKDVLPRQLNIRNVSKPVILQNASVLRLDNHIHI